MTTWMEANPKLAAITLAEQQRVAAVVAEDIAYRADLARGPLDFVTGEVRRVRPTEITAARRRQAANAMPENETTDTIGKLWAWGLLDGERFAGDLLRDAGRRYGAAYWHRYGQVCAQTPSYSGLGMGVRSGPPSIVIPDPERDELNEAFFQNRDDALRRLDRRVKVLVDQMCVDGAGDNDPGWLVDLIAGYPVETRTMRGDIGLRELACGFGTKDEQRRKERLAADARRRLDAELRRLRAKRLPNEDISILCTGLVALAEIDRCDGFHRARRSKKSGESE